MSTGPGSSPSPAVHDQREVSFRPLEAGDYPLLARWQSTPHVARWWLDPSDLESIAAMYATAASEGDRTEVFIIQLDHRPIGLIQRYRHADEAEWDRVIGVPGAAGIDYYIGEMELLGRGLGAAALASFAAKTLRDFPDVECVVAVPQQENVASWRALEKAGFVRVWAGTLDTEEPADQGPAFIYRIARAERAARPT